MCMYPAPNFVPRAFQLDFMEKAQERGSSITLWGHHPENEVARYPRYTKTLGLEKVRKINKSPKMFSSKQFYF